MFRDRTRLVEYLVVVAISVLVSLGVLAGTGRLASVGTGAASLLDQIVARGTLRAGIPIIGLPIANRDASGAIVGFLPDLYAEMARVLKVELEIVDTAAANRIPFLQAGQIDLTTGSVTLERALVVSYAGIWDMDGTNVAYLDSSGIETIDDINGKRIVTQTGSTGELLATELFPDSTIQRVDAASTSIQAVLSGQADVAIEDRSVLRQAADEHPELVFGPNLRAEPSGIMVKRGDHEWSGWVGHFLDDFYSAGLSTCGCGGDLYEKWYGVPHLPFTPDY